MTVYFLVTQSLQTHRHGVSQVCIHTRAQPLPKGGFFYISSALAAAEAKPSSPISLGVGGSKNAESQL